MGLWNDGFLCCRLSLAIEMNLTLLRESYRNVVQPLRGEEV